MQKVFPDCVHEIFPCYFVGWHKVPTYKGAKETDHCSCISATQIASELIANFLLLLT